MGRTYSEDDIARFAKIVEENITSQFKTGFEAIDSIKEQVSKIPAIEQTLTTISKDMKATELALTDTNKDLKLTKEYVERFRTKIPLMDMTISSVKHDTDVIKIRTEKLEIISDELEDVKVRLQGLESAA